MRLAPITLPLACLLLSACGSGDEAARNGAQPVDAAVAEGTIDDRMTDLDAAQVDGLAQPAANATAQPAAQAARRVARDTEAEAEQDAEAVAAE